MIKKQKKTMAESVEKKIKKGLVDNLGLQDGSFFDERPDILPNSLIKQSEDDIEKLHNYAFSDKNPYATMIFDDMMGDNLKRVPVNKDFLLPCFKFNDECNVPIPINANYNSRFTQFLLLFNDVCDNRVLKNIGREILSTLSAATRMELISLSMDIEGFLGEMLEKSLSNSLDEKELIGEEDKILEDLMQNYNKNGLNCDNIRACVHPDFKTDLSIDNFDIEKAIESSAIEDEKDKYGVYSLHTMAFYYCMAHPMVEDKFSRSYAGREKNTDEMDKYRGSRLENICKVFRQNINYIVKNREMREILPNTDDWLKSPVTQKDNENLEKEEILKMNLAKHVFHHMEYYCSSVKHYRNIPTLYRHPRNLILGSIYTNYPNAMSEDILSNIANMFRHVCLKSNNKDYRFYRETLDYKLPIRGFVDKNGKINNLLIAKSFFHGNANSITSASLFTPLLNILKPFYRYEYGCPMPINYILECNKNDAPSFIEYEEYLPKELKEDYKYVMDAFLQNGNNDSILKDKLFCEKIFQITKSFMDEDIKAIEKGYFSNIKPLSVGNRKKKTRKILNFPLNIATHGPVQTFLKLFTIAYRNDILLLLLRSYIQDKSAKEIHSISDKIESVSTEHKLYRIVMSLLPNVPNLTLPCLLALHDVIKVVNAAGALAHGQNSNDYSEKKISIQNMTEMEIYYHSIIILMINHSAGMYNPIKQGINDEYCIITDKLFGITSQKEFNDILARYCESSKNKINHNIKL